jgi:hypothetical protein
MMKLIVAFFFERVYELLRRRVGYARMYGMLLKINAIISCGGQIFELYEL